VSLLVQTREAGNREDFGAQGQVRWRTVHNPREMARSIFVTFRHLDRVDPSGQAVGGGPGRGPWQRAKQRREHARSSSSGTLVSEVPRLLR
jgi:hypothetical protein